MAKYSEFKQELKALASKIRSDKSSFRKSQSIGKATYSMGHELMSERIDFRHQHIAYCLLRGRTYEQIEPKVAPGNEPMMARVYAIMDKRRIVTEEASDAEAVCAGS